MHQKFIVIGTWGMSSVTTEEAAACEEAALNMHRPKGGQSYNVASTVSTGVR